MSIEEHITFVVDSQGVTTIQRDLKDVGNTGERSARQIRDSFKLSMKDMAYNARVAMNSTKLAEQMKVNMARASAMEISKLRRSEGQAAKDAAKVAQQAARATARVEVEQARAGRRAALAERTKMAQAKKDATFGMGNFGAVIGVLGLRSAIGGFLEYSDAAIEVSNRLQIVTSSEQELTNVTQLLRQSALDSRAEFDLTTRSYARLAQSTKQLQISQAGNLIMTETLTKAIAVSGATSAEAHATLIQFSQAMGSNRLSADEFRSVAEQLPIILDLLAATTGKARTELKQMGQEGKLTARIMSLSLLEGFEKIDAMFKKTSPTIEQAWENIKTQTRFAVIEFNKATGAAQSVVAALQWVAANMDTMTLAAKTLGSMVGVYLVVQVGLAAKGLALLALANPFTALAIAAAGAVVAVRHYHDAILDAIGVEHDLVWDSEGLRIANRGDKVVINKFTGKAERSGDKATRDARELKESQYQGDKDLLHKEYMKEQRDKEIKRLRAMKDKEQKDKKGGKGRHVSTFDEAIRGLEDDVAGLSLKKGLGRDTAIENMKIQNTIQRALTESEAEYVAQLIKTKTTAELLEKAQEEASQARQKRYDEETKAIVELKKRSEEARAAAIKLRGEQLTRENLIHNKKFDSFNSVEDVKEGRRTVKDMFLGGRLKRGNAESALDFMEMQDPNTKEPRKAFLEETNGVGKMAEQMQGIFGPEGTLNKGLGDATANAIVFHQSFSKSLHALAQQIEADIISTLVSGLIRMAILSAMGGGESGAAAASALSALGKPKSQGGYVSGPGYAMGGYTGNNGRTRIAGYVHGGEYVLNANATQRIGHERLNAMNKGDDGGGRAPRIVINNNSGVRIEQQQGMTREEVVLVAREESAKEAGRTVAGQVRDPNSYVGKSLRSNTTARYQR